MTCHGIWPGLALAIAMALVPTRLQADPYRLRGDALARAESPVGLLALTADGELYPWLSAEAVVWIGAGEVGSTGDVLVIAARLRDPRGRGHGRLGRFVAIVGALRPLHIDGAWGSMRLPWRMRVEAFAGVPVEPRFGADAYDWAAGARISRGLGQWGSAGIGYLHRRDAGWLADEEIAADGSWAPARWLDVAGRLAFDLIDTGISEAHISAATRRDAWRVELFALHRSPARILPATSLFSVLGDVPSQQAGLSARWRAAPRLDIDGSAAVRRLGAYPGAEDRPVGSASSEAGHGQSLSLRVLLRLDDRGKSAVSLEARREHTPGAGWIGLRAVGRIALTSRVVLATEAELVRPEDMKPGTSAGQTLDRGTLWPWALIAARWQISPEWRVAAAVEASASPEHDYRVDALARASRSWEMQ